MKQLSPMGITNYASTYQESYAGKRGESRNFQFYYQSSYSLSPNVAPKPPYGGAISPSSCGRPSGY